MVWTLKTPVLLGDSQHVGGDDWNRLMNLFSGTPVDTVLIGAPWTFNSGSLNFLDPSSNFTYNITSSNILGNVTLNLPLVTDSPDNLLAANTADAITNKTIVASQNTITEIGANSGDMLVHNGTNFVDLPRGLGFQIMQMTGDGTDVNWVTHQFWDPNLLESLTNKTIDPTVNTITDSTSGLGDLMKNDGFSYKRFPMGIAGQILSVSSDGTDLLWTSQTGAWNPNQVETLTNKIIDSTTNTITLKKVTITDFAHAITHGVGSTDPFIKSTILGGQARYVELLTPVDAGQDTGRIWVNGRALKYWDNQTTPAMQTIESQGNRGVPNGYCDLDLNGQVPVGRIPAIGVKANLPTDTVFQDDVQILTNKTLVLENNIITSLAAQIGSILTHDGTRFHALPPGATNQALQTKADGTLSWANVGVWDPAAVEAFVSKTIKAAQNKLPDVDKLPSSGLKNGHVFWPVNNVPQGHGLLYGVQIRGNLGQRIMDAEGQYKGINTGGTPNSPTGMVWLDSITRRSYNPRFTVRFKLDKSTNNRLAIGLTSNLALPITDTLLGPTDSGIFLGFRPGDANYIVFLNNGTTNEQTDGSLGRIKDTAWHTVVIQAKDSTPSWTVTLDAGTPIVYTSPSLIPGSTTPLVPMIITESTLTNAPFNIFINWADHEQGG